MSKDLQSAPAQSGAADQGGAVENGENQDASQPVQIPGERSAVAADQGAPSRTVKTNPAPSSKGSARAYAKPPRPPGCKDTGC